MKLKAAHFLNNYTAVCSFLNYSLSDFKFVFFRVSTPHNNYQQEGTGGNWAVQQFGQVNRLDFRIQPSWSKSSEFPRHGQERLITLSRCRRRSIFVGSQREQTLSILFYLSLLLIYQLREYLRLIYQKMFLISRRMPGP